MIFQRIIENQKKGVRQIVATVTQVKGSAPREVGAKMIITDKEIFSTIGGGALEKFAIEEARKILIQGGSQKAGVPLCSKVGQCCGGYVEIFFDIVETRPQLYIFGAGHITQSLLEVMNGTEFDLHLIDERVDWIQTSETARVRLPQLEMQTHRAYPIDWLTKNKEKIFGSYVLVMTHDHSLDQEIIEFLMPLRAHFVGLIGSQTKKQRFIKRLTEKGLSEKELSQLHCPVGQLYNAPEKSKIPKIVATSIAFQLFEEAMKQKSKDCSSLRSVSQKSSEMPEYAT